MYRQQPKTYANVIGNLPFSNNIDYIQNNTSILNHQLHNNFFGYLFASARYASTGIQINIHKKGYSKFIRKQCK